MEDDISTLPQQLERGRSYSESFSRFCLNNYFQSHNISITARKCQVSRPFIYKCIQNWTRHNQIQKIRRKQAGRKKIFTVEDTQWLSQLVEENSDRYQQELVEDFLFSRRKLTSTSTISRMLHCLRFTRKKINTTPVERLTAVALEKRAEFLAQLAQYSWSDIFFVDETSVDCLIFQRKWGWSRQNQRLSTARRYVRGQKYTILSCINSIVGLTSYRIIVGDANTSDFNSYITDLVLPQVSPNGAIIMDNCSIHKSYDLQALVQLNNKELLFTSPYSPDLNPIEMSYAFFKQQLKKNRVTGSRLKEGIIDAIQQITPKLVQAWILKSYS